MLHYHYQNDACMMGSDERHFNVPLILRDILSHRKVNKDNVCRERRTEAELNQGPFAYHPHTPLHQTSFLRPSFKFSVALHPQRP